MSTLSRRQLLQAVPPFLVTPHDVSLPNLILIVTSAPVPAAFTAQSARARRASASSPASLLTGFAQPTSTSPTLADLLRSRGYRTAFLGEWPLGNGPGESPQARGFDEVVRTPPAPSKRPLFLYINGALPELPYKTNTLTVITAPSGTQVPLVAHSPGMIPAGDYNEPVSHLDVVPTFLRVAGLPAPQGLPGLSLLPLWTGDAQTLNRPKQAAPADSGRPSLFFREDWRETDAATPVTQDHVANPNLTLQLYGPGREGVNKSHHDKPADDPFYIWSGTATGNWAVTLRHRTHNADLTGQSKIRWRSKQAGFRELRIVIKLASGQWLVSSESDGPSDDWREREFILAGMRWRKLDIKTITEAAWVLTPDLSRVEEIGFTDLMSGGESVACSRLDWIEVWARGMVR